MRGLIVKLVGGLYTIKVNSELYEAKARGNFRHKKVSPLVGDWVTFEKGYILDIDERKNEMKRPVIANIDQVLLVFSAKEPEISYLLLDRLISLSEVRDIEVKIIITKMDLLDSTEAKELSDKLSYYQRWYEVHYTKSLFDHNFKDFSLFKDRVTVLAGQSGVGKSSLINAITGSEILTQPISMKLGRGKHTTRHSELIEVHGGLVADTPGFSALDFSEYMKEDIRDSFIDFQEYAEGCKFRGCFHVNEPKCNVKENLDEILETRYRNYLQIMRDVEDNKEWRKN